MCAWRWAVAAARRSVGGVRRQLDGLRSRPMPLDSTATTVACRADSDTTCTERTTAGLAPGPDHDGGVVRDLGEQVRGLVQQLLEPAVGGVEELADPLRGDRVEPAGRGHVVDEEAVALVGGDAPGRRVRLGEVALLLEHGHLVAHGGRADLHAGRIGDVRGPHRLRGGDVLLHDGSQDGGLAFVEHGLLEQSRRLAVEPIDCQRVDVAVPAQRLGAFGARGRPSAPGSRGRAGRARGDPQLGARRTRPSGSNRSACVVGLNTRKYGAASVPVPAAHCQPWLFDARSPSTRWRMKWRAPHCHGRWRSLTRKLATSMRTRLCIHPVASSWRIPASMIGKPVRARRPTLRTVRRAAASVSTGIASIRAVEVLPGRLGAAEQHVGVELAPRQLVGEHLVPRRIGRRGRRAAVAGGRGPTAERRTAGSCRPQPGRSRCVGRSRRARRRQERVPAVVRPPPRRSPAARTPARRRRRAVAAIVGRAVPLARRARRAARRPAASATLARTA